MADWQMVAVIVTVVLLCADIVRMARKIRRLNEKIARQEKE